MNSVFTNASEMLWETGFSEENDTMPQTVPTSGQSPPSATAGAPCGGSALAGRERAVPDAHPPPPTPPELFHELPATLLDADTHMLKQHTLPSYHTHEQQITFDSNLDRYPNSQIDYRRFTSDLSSYCTEEPEEVLRNITYDNSAASILEQFYNFGYRSPQYPTPSPSSEEGSVCLPPSINIQPCSPQYTQETHLTVGDISAPIYCTVKEEPLSNHFHLSPNYGSPYPLSPSGSCTSYYSGPSPACTSVSSPSQYQDEFIDIEQLLKGSETSQDIDSDHSLGDSRLDECSALLTPKEEKEDTKPRDHRLLREVLEDTSFQKRFNLKPIQLNGYSEQLGEGHSIVKMEEGECDDEELLSPRTNALTSEKIDQVLSLAIEQTRKDVDDTCNVLGISPEPTRWNWPDVRAWLTFTTRQFSLPSLSLEFVAPMDGAALVALSEEDFNRLAPQGGSTLYAQLEIWKAARASSCAWSTAAHDENSDDEDMESSVAAAAAVAGAAAAVGATNGKARTGGAHIHLWQFLKELLGAPELHGSAIRWLDRANGVFKIEDSVRVARLWGKRKNRPAMNYDKLSRSIRQYYKKGIMKKTERSQRLVYQFCHPYCL